MADSPKPPPPEETTLPAKPKGGRQEGDLLPGGISREELRQEVQRAVEEELRQRSRRPPEDRG